MMHIRFLLSIAGTSLSLVQAQQNAAAILPQCAVSQLFALISLPGTFEHLR